MFGNNMELMKKVQELEIKLANHEKERELAVEAAKNEIRKEMQKRLIESDIQRVEAIAKLETYEKFNTKDEMEQIKKMLSQTINALSNQKSGEIKIIK